jgi:hypothetical protein
MDKRNIFHEKKCRGGVRGGVETETTMSAGEGPSSGRPRAPEIEENWNAKRCCNWIRARADEMAAKRKMMMSAREGPSSGKQERAGEGAAKWARSLPHVCEHKCLVTTKRC